jgi:hypothetical protein
MTDYTMGATDSRHVGNYLSEYLDNVLPEAERREVETHLRDCLRCSADLRTLRLTVRAVGRLPLDPVPRSFAIPSEVRPGTPVTSFLRWSTRLLAAALVLFLAVGIVLPAVAPRYGSRSGPATGPFVAPAQAPTGPGQSSAVGQSNELAQRATVQASGRATVSAMQRSAATAAPAAAAVPAAPAPPQAASDAASGAPTAPPGGVAASAPAAAPASGAAAAPTNSSVASLAQGAATTSNSPSGQSPQPAAVAAVKSQGQVSTPVTGSYPLTTPPPAVPTPVTGSYPMAPQPLVVSTPLPLGTYPAESSSGQSVVPEDSYPAPEAATPARPVASAPTTWFTPALGLLILIAVVAAIGMSWFGRRRR